MEDTKPQIIISKPGDDSQAIISELRTKILKLEAGLEEANSKVRPSPYSIYFPPYRATSNLTHAQQRMQTFPYSMSKSDGITTWAIGLVITAAWIAFPPPYLARFWVPLVALRPDNMWIDVSILVALSVGTQFILGYNVYPVVYACILRWKLGQWPTWIQVWKSEKEKEEERAKGEVRSPVTGLLSFLVTFIGYTFVGLFIIALFNTGFRRRQRANSGARRGLVGEDRV